MKKLLTCAATLACIAMGSVAMAADAQVPIHPLQKYWLETRGFQIVAGSEKISEAASRPVYDKCGKLGEKKIMQRDVRFSKVDRPSITSEPVHGWKVDYKVESTVDLTYFWYNEPFVRSTFVYLDETDPYLIQEEEKFAVANPDVILPEVVMDAAELGGYHKEK